MIMNNIKLILKNFILKVYTVLEESYNLVFALGIVLGLFYIRLIPRVSRDLWNTMTQYQFAITLFNIAFVIVTIVIILRILKLLPEKIPGNFTEKVILLVRAIRDYIVWMLINFYEFVGYSLTFLVKKIFNKDHFFYHCVRYLSKFILRQNKNVVFVILISINLIPQSIFMLAFTYDVIVLQQLHYTFMCLPLLLVALLEQIILFIFTHFYDINIESISSFMQTTVVSDTEEEIIEKHEFIPKFQKSPPEWFDDLNDYFYNHYEVLNHIKALVEEYKRWKHQDFPYYYIRLSLCILRLILLLLTLLYNIL